MNLRQEIVGNRLRLLQRVHDLLVVGVVEGVHHGIEFLNELIETRNTEGIKDLFDFLIGEAVLGLDISDHRQEVELLRVDLLEQHRTVGLINNFCHKNHS